MPEATVIDPVAQGLENPDGTLTPYGEVVLKTAGQPDAKLARANYKKGFVDENLDFTRRGRIRFGTREDAIKGGPADWVTWKETGAESEWKSLNGLQGSFSEKVAKVAGQIATEMAPQSVKGSGLLRAMTMPMFIGQRRVEMQTGADLNAVMTGKSVEFLNQFQKVMQGETAREAMRNQAVMSAGLALGFTHLNPSATDRDKDYAQWAFENAMLQLDELTTSEAAGAAASIGALLPGGKTPGEAAADTAGAVQQAERDLGVEASSVAKRVGRAQGEMFADPSQFVPTGAAIGGIKAFKTGGFTVSRAARTGRKLIELKSARNALIAAGKKATSAEVRALDDQIAEVGGTLTKMEARSGTLGMAKDFLRDRAARLADGNNQSLASKGFRGVQSVGRKLDEIAEGMAERSKRALQLAEGIGVASLVYGNPLGATLGIGALAVQNSKRIKSILRGTYALGETFMERRGTLPYFQKLSNKAANNKYVRSTADALDWASRPIDATKRMGRAAAHAIAAEAPFSWIAAGGQEGWLVDAFAEGLVFGSPGIAKAGAPRKLVGLINGMGGTPSVAEAAEFDAMAMQDGLELRRSLPDEGQRRAFDSLAPMERRVIGAHSALHPDVNYRFAPGTGINSYNRDSHRTITIDPLSKHALDGLISHEVTHHMFQNGLAETVYATLIGTDDRRGYLYNEDGSLTDNAKAFKDEYEANARSQYRKEWQARNPGLPITKDVQNTISDLAEMSPELLAEEYYVESVVPMLRSGLNSRRLQQIARRDRVTRAVLRGMIDRGGLLQNLALRLGGMIDERGGVRFSGNLKTQAKLPETLRRLTNEYLIEAGGRTQSAENISSRERRSPGMAIDHRKKENYNLLKRNSAFKQKDGVVVRDPVTGVPVELDWAEKKAMEQVGTSIRQWAESQGIDIGPDGMFMFNAQEWADLLARLRTEGNLNRNQLEALELIALSVTSDTPIIHSVNYNKALETRKNGKKVYTSKVGPEQRAWGFFQPQVTKAGNVIIFAYDQHTLAQNIRDLAGTREGLDLYNGSHVDIENDIDLMMRNWQEIAQGKLAEDHNRRHFGPKKMRFLNAILGDVGAGQKDINPLLMKRPFNERKRSVIKSPRLDRINWIETTDHPNRWQQELAKTMRLPEIAPVTPAQDRAYLAAVEQGDMEAAQSMVDDEGRRVDFLPETKQLQTSRGLVIGPAVHYLPEPVYHGTPHKVDRFSLDKIGTGEGAQAYGWGLYFAERRETGIAYAKNVKDEKKISAINAQMSELAKVMNRYAIHGEYRKFSDPAGEEASIRYDWLMEKRAKLIDDPGNLYTVKLKPEADEFLDWDKPLSQQSEKVREALKDDETYQSAFGLVYGDGVSAEHRITGAQYYETAQRAVRADDERVLYDDYPVDKALSEKLHAAGIKGIRYLDGNSRDKGEGSYNYVIFDEGDIEIIEENGKRVRPRKEQPKPKILNDRGRTRR